MEIIDPAPEVSRAHLRISEAPHVRGELRWLGYPKRVLPDGELPETFDYAQLDAEASWATHAGFLTRYGDVLPLLTAADDRFVVMSHGEELALSFDAGKMPPLPKGWKRTFLFWASGYEKGFEVHAADFRTVAPLPFRNPDDEMRTEYLLEWNTRPSCPAERKTAAAERPPEHHASFSR